MKQIKDRKLLNHYLSLHHVRDLFSTPDVPFQLYRLEKGEYLNNELDPKEYFSFVAEGAYQIMNVDDSGRVYRYPESSGFNCLGDLEFATGEYSPYLIEIVKTVYVISIPLKDTEAFLRRDPLFLNYIIHNLGLKLSRSQRLMLENGTNTEKVLVYLRTMCPDQTLKGTGKAAVQLRMSRRQLQRILKEYCAQGIIKKTGRGTYRLMQE